jgi:hypothetical protein
MVLGQKKNLTPNGQGWPELELPTEIQTHGKTDKRKDGVHTYGHGSCRGKQASQQDLKRRRASNGKLA